MNYYIIEFDNGYAGCKIEYIEACEGEIEDEYVQMRFVDYMEEYEYVAAGYDWETGWETEEDEDWYYNSGDYAIMPITEQEYEEYLENGYEKF